MGKIKDIIVERLALAGLFLLMCAARCQAQEWGRMASVDMAYTVDTMPPASVIRRVYDGDSYEFAGLMPPGKAGREEGIDAPEKRTLYVSVEQRYGQQAADSVRSIIRGREITYTVYGIDRYNRPRVSVYIEGQPIAEIALARGWAWYYSPNKLPSVTKRKYKALERDAKKKKLGLWADKKPIRPAAWRKAHPMPK